MNLLACLCGSKSWAPGFQARHSTYRRCDSCGTHFRISVDVDKGQREDFRDTYARQPRVQSAAERRRQLWPDLLERIANSYDEDHPNQSGRKPNLLDVGCGFGDFLVAAQKLDWMVHGIEMNQLMKEKCEELGIEITSNLLPQGAYATKSFDVITYFNVLDSIPDPVKELETARKRLSKAGRAWIRVPNGSFHTALLSRLKHLPALGSWYLNREWSPLNTWMITPKGLRLLLEGAGFGSVRITASPLKHRGILGRLLEKRPQIGSIGLCSSSILASGRKE